MDLFERRSKIYIKGVGCRKRDIYEKFLIGKIIKKFIYKKQKILKFFQILRLQRYCCNEFFIESLILIVYQASQWNS